MNENDPLNPCPFCNTIPILQHSPETGFHIHCPTCQSYTHGVQWSEAEALAVWNNRPSPWTYITDSLPPNHTRLIVSSKGGEVADAQYTGGRFLYNDDNKEVVGVYAYMDWPEAAVYEESE